MTRDELARQIADTAVLRGSFTLRSGRTSSYYVDKYLFSTNPKILTELGRIFARQLPAETTRLAGAELGGIPLVTAASLASGLPCVLVRREAKGYGTSKQLEGHLEPGDRVVVVEDVVTTGGQSIEAAKLLTGAGAEVLKITAVVDRQDGGRENIEKAGYVFEAIFTAEELGVRG